MGIRCRAFWLVEYYLDFDDARVFSRGRVRANLIHLANDRPDSLDSARQLLVQRHAGYRRLLSDTQSSNVGFINFRNRVHAIDTAEFQYAVGIDMLAGARMNDQHLARNGCVDFGEIKFLPVATQSGFCNIDIGLRDASGAFRRRAVGIGCLGGATGPVGLVFGCQIARLQRRKAVGFALQHAGPHAGRGRRTLTGRRLLLGQRQLGARLVDFRPQYFGRIGDGKQLSSRYVIAYLDIEASQYAAGRRLGK